MKIPCTFWRFTLGLWLLSPSARGQGGPPLVTDDPGTPGPGRWEVNIAVLAEKRPSEHALEAPLVDANYGVGDRIQLKIEVPWIFRREDAAPAENGIGNALLGVKWRFLEAESAGVDVATYPQVELNLSRSSANKGLVDREPGLILPLIFARPVGPVALNVEVGGLFRRGEKARLTCGLAAGHELSEKVEILAEIYGDASTRLTEAGSAWNLGARWKIRRKAILLVSAGSGISGTEEEPRARFQGYLGAQVLF